MQIPGAKGKRVKTIRVFEGKLIFDGDGWWLKENNGQEYHLGDSKSDILSEYKKEDRIKITIEKED